MIDPHPQPLSPYGGKGRGVFVLPLLVGEGRGEGVEFSLESFNYG